ncbi:MAG TPA: autotransporter-associated beta strand repeat-containing protein, partial [Tepidisphaeraceae bacterium]|nr:autotransporter-associated beta strand repeat-containing protein [Tepidisphaeraceae bacterium]
MTKSSSGSTTPRRQTSKRILRTAILATPAVAAAVLFGSSVRAADPLYWDINGTTAGATNDAGGIASGTWANSGFANWNTTSSGDTTATLNWGTGGKTAVFSAGANGTGASTITLSGTSIADVQGMTFEEGTVTIAGGSGLTLTEGTITVNSPAAASITGVIAGSAGLTKAGTGVLTLTGANTFTGPVAITGGALAVNSDGALGAASNALSITDAALNITTSIGGSAAAPNTRNIAITGNATINMVGGSATFHSGVISGTGSLTKTGGVSLVLGTANTYTGNTIINQATLVSMGINSLGATSNSIEFTGATGQLRLSTAYDETRAMALGAAGGNLEVSTGLTATASGVISGAGPLTKAGAGTGTLVLRGANSYTGNTAVNAGTLIANSPASLPGYNVAGKVNVGASGTVGVSVGGAGQWSDADTDTALNTTTITAGGRFAFNVDTGNTYTRATDVSKAGVPIVKVGGGTLAFTAANTYTGATTVSEGTLLVNNTTGSGTGTGNVTVASGGTLGGTGRIGAGTAAGTSLLTIQSGGTFAPGVAGAGTLTVDKLTLSSGSINNFTFDGSNVPTLVNVTGTGGLTLSGGAFNITAPNLVPGSYTLIDYVPVSGTQQLAGGGSNNISVVNAPAGFDYEFSLDTTTSALKLIVTTASATGGDATWVLDGNSQWHNAAGWSTNAVPEGAGVAVTFGGAITAGRTITASGTAKTVGSITYDSAISYIVNGGAPIKLDATSGDATVTVLQGSHSLSAPQQLIDPATYNIAAGGNLNIGDVISGAALTKTGAGSLTLNSKPTSAVTVSAGTLIASAGNMPTENITNNARVEFTNGVTAYGGVIGGTSTSAQVVMGSAQQNAFGATGFSGANTFAGTLYTHNTLFSLSGTNGSVASAAGVDVFRGSLILNNGTNNTNRIGNAPVTLRAANLSFLGNNAAAASESFGNLVLATGGMNFVSFTPGTSTFGGSITASSLVRQEGGFAIVRGVGLGTNTGAFAQLKFTSAPVASGAVIPGVLADSASVTANGSVATLATYGANGVQMLAAANYDTTTNPATGSNFAPGAATTIAASKTLGAIEFGGASNVAATAGQTITVGSGQNLTVSSGMIYSNSTTASTITGGTLSFGNASGGGEGIVANYTGLTIASNISSTGFTKVGNGTLTLTGANNFNGGGVHLHQGTTVVNSTARLAGAGSVTIGNIGTNDTTVGYRGGALQLTSATGNYTAPLTMHGNPGGALVPAGGVYNGALDNAGTGTSNTWSGDITLMGYDLNGGNTLYNSFTAASGTTLTLSGAIKNGTRPDGTAINAGFYTGGNGDIVFTGANANTFGNFIRPLGGRLIVEKDAAFGSATTDQALGVLMSALSSGVNGQSASTIAFRAPASSPAGFNYATKELLQFAGQGNKLDGVFLENLGGANTFAGGLNVYSDVGVASNNGGGVFRINIADGSLELSGTLGARVTTLSSVNSPTIRNMVKEGPGDLIITGNSTGTLLIGSQMGAGSSFDIRQGALVLKGNGVMPAGVTNYKVSPGSSITLDNSGTVLADRIGAGATVAMVGGELKLLGHASSNVTQKAAGVNVGSFSIFTVQPASGATGTTTLRFADSNDALTSISRTARGTALLRGMNNSSTFIDMSSAGMIGGSGGAGSTTIAIVPYLVGDSSATGAGSDFVTVDSNGHARTLTGGEYGTLTSTNSETVNASVGAGANAAISTGTFNSVKLNSGSSVSIGGSLSLKSAAILATGSGSITGGEVGMGLGVYDVDNDVFGPGQQEGVITVIGAGNTLTIGSKITGLEGLTKSGDGSLVLSSTTSTFGGGSVPITINAGNLKFADDANLGNAGNEIRINGGTLWPTASTTSARKIDLSSVGTNAIHVDSGVFTAGGVVSGNALTKRGAGDLVLAGTNIYTGGTTISDGQVSVSAPANLGTGAVTLAGGRLHPASGSYTNAVNVGTAPATIRVDPADTVTWTGNIAGTGTLNLDGGGVFHPLSGAFNTHTGDFKVTNGSTLRYSNQNGLSTIVTARPSHWQLDGGKLQFVGIATGSVTNTGGRGITLGALGGTVELDSTNAPSAGYTVSLGSTGEITGSGDLTKSMTGTGTIFTNIFSIGTVNSYTGKTIITGGTLRIGADAGLGPAPVGDAVADKLQIAGGARLEISAASPATPTLAATRGITLTSGVPLIDAATGTTARVNGVIAGTANTGLTRSGAGNMTFGAQNTYAGATNLVGGATDNAGAITRLGIDNALPTGTTLNINGTGTAGRFTTFDLSDGAGNSYNQTVAGLQNTTPTGGGTATLTNSGATVKTFTVNNAIAGNFDGVISGALNFKKSNTGTYTLNGVAKTYTGATIVDTGTLKSGANGILPATTTLTLENGGKFDADGKTQTLAGLTGTGSVTDTAGGGALTLGGVVIPGTDGTAGGLSVTPGLTLTNGTAFKFDLSNNVASGNDTFVADSIASSPTNSFGLTINPLNGSLAAGDYVLIAGTTSNALTAGMFTAPTSTTPGQTWTLAKVGNNIVLQVAGGGGGGTGGTWVGAAATNWTAGGSWSSGGAPVAGDAATFDGAIGGNS